VARRDLGKKLQDGTNWLKEKETTMGYILLWLIGIPIPILIILALLHH
jgi:hypothetical protein